MSLEKLVKDCAEGIEYSQITRDGENSLRKIFTFKVNNQVLENLINSCVEFQYKAKAPKGFKTEDESGKSNITKEQRDLIENSVVSGNFKFKEALQEAFFDEIFARMKGDSKAETSNRVLNMISEEEGYKNYTLEFDELKDIGEVDFSGIKIEDYESSVAEEDIENEIKTVLDVQTYLDDAEDQSRPATADDAININFKGYVGGKLFDGGSADNFSVTLGQKKMLPDFEAGIVGMKTGETKIVNVKFPDNYGAPAMAGLTAEFHITLNKILESKKFKSVEEFLEKQGISDLDQFKEMIKKELEFNLDNILWAVQKNQLSEKLCESINVEIPKLIVEQQFSEEKNHYMQNKIRELQQKIANGEETSNLDSSKIEIEKELEDLKQAIEKKVKLSIILMAIAKTNSLEPSDKDREDEIMRQAKLSRMSVNEFINKLNNDKTRGMIDNVLGLVFEKMVLKFIITKLNPDKIDMKYDEVKDRYKAIFIDGGKKWSL